MISVLNVGNRLLNRIYLYCPVPVRYPADCIQNLLKISVGSFHGEDACLLCDSCQFFCRIIRHDKIRASRNNRAVFHQIGPVVCPDYDSFYIKAAAI